MCAYYIIRRKQYNIVSIATIPKATVKPFNNGSKFDVASIKLCKEFSGMLLGYFLHIIVPTIL